MLSVFVFSSSSSTIAEALIGLNLDPRPTPSIFLAVSYADPEVVFCSGMVAFAPLGYVSAPHWLLSDTSPPDTLEKFYNSSWLDFFAPKILPNIPGLLDAYLSGSSPSV